LEKGRKDLCYNDGGKQVSRQDHGADITSQKRPCNLKRKQCDADMTHHSFHHYVLNRSQEGKPDALGAKSSAQPINVFPFDDSHAEPLNDPTKGVYATKYSYNANVT
jgi:hypothetical protein